MKKYFYVIIVFLTFCQSCSNKKDFQILSDQSVGNLIAFTKLYGYVRYFHPSSEAQKIDWDKFAIFGMAKTESASNVNELRNILKDLFLPIAPTLIIYNKNNYNADELKEYSPESNDKLKEVIWKHHGYSESGNGPTNYKLIGENSTDTVFKNLPVKDKVFRSEIGAGLSVIMPIVLFSDSIGTLPRGDTSKVIELLKNDDVSKFDINNINRYVRFADIAITWNVMQHFYPYFDVIKSDWQAELPRAFKEAAVDTTGIDFLNTLKKFTAILNDGHNEIIYGKSDNKDFYPGLRWEVIQNQLVITEVLDENKDKLKPGDVVTEIDGINAILKLASYDSLVSGATLEWKRVDRIASFFTFRKGSLEILASGKENSVLKIKVIHIDNTVSFVEILREHNSYHSKSEHDKIYEIEKGIYYIDMTRCTQEDYSSYRSRLTNSKGIIYDCRGFPQMFDLYVSDMTCENNVYTFKMYTSLILYPDRKDIEYDAFPPVNFTGSVKYLKAPKIVITNSRAISGAESLLLTIKHYKLATIIGEHTAATDGSMNGFTLPGGYQVIFTGKKFLNYDDSQFHGIGVIPDILISKSIKGVSDERDELLDKAIEVLTNNLQNKTKIIKK